MLKYRMYRWLMLVAAVFAVGIGHSAFAAPAVTGGSAPSAGVVAQAPMRGVIRVKLQNEAAATLGHTPRVAPSQTASLSTGLTAIDRAAKAVKAIKMTRMIPYSPKHEAQHRAFGLDRWYEVTFDEGVDPRQAAKIFGAVAGVEIAETVTPMSLKEGNGPFRVVSGPAKNATGAQMPFNDPRLPQQWHYNNDGSMASSVAGADINLFDAWRINTGSPDVLVAIIDGGVDYKHEDLARNMHVNLAELNGTPGVDDDGNGYVDDIYGYNFCTNSADVYPHSHGTHVAGTVAAVTGNGIGVAGVAGGNGSADSGVRMISCQVFDSRSGVPETNYAAAIVYAADMGANIAQCSWGWDGAGYKEQAVLDAIDYFTKAARSDRMNGGLCIFAAGNNGENGLYYPAAYEPCLAVAAMTSELLPASYSNRGEWVDVTAPGGLLDYGTLQGVLSTLPNNEYGYNEGTSMATPHVSGIAALILSQYGSPTFVSDNLRTQLETSVNDFYGYGDNSKVAGLFGSGYIDAGKALSLDTEGVPQAVGDFTLAAGQDYMQVSWTIPAASDNNVNHHIIYYSTEPFTAQSDLSAVPSVVADTKFLSTGDSYTHEVAGLKALTQYYVGIVAVNRWGRASELSAVKTVTTNAGPEMTVDAGSGITIATTAAAPVGQGNFTIGNTAEGLLKWQAGKRTVSASLKSVARPVITASPYKGKLALEQVRRAKAAAAPEYDAADYPADIAYYDMHWAAIGDNDKTLPNSAAQWFHVDPAQYPDGFNLTHIKMEGNYGANPVIQIYRGDVAISSATMLQQVDYQFWVYNYNIALNEQLYFAPGESFWVVIHFEGGQEGYPLGMGRSESTDRANTAYMSNDMGQTWTQLATALKGSNYEADAAHFVWSITARSLNPDWSQALDLTPAQGTVRQGETQQVTVSADGSKFVNGTYKMNVVLNTNEASGLSTSVPVSLTVAGNAPKVQMPKVVDFGNVLVGQSKTLTVEAYNAGYGSMRGSQWSAGIYSDNITSSSEHFVGPDYLGAGFPARTKVTFDVTYAPTADGSHTGAITFKDADGNQVRLLVQGSATQPAKLQVEPAVIDADTLTVGADPSQVTFNITNTGKYPLEYVFPKFSDEQIDGATKANHKFGYTVASTLPGFNAMEYTAPAPLIGATDIAAKFSDNVYVSDAINPGFSFPYYGKTYDRLYITSYGGIMFGQNPENFWAPLTETSSSIAGTGLISAYGRQVQLAPDSKIEYAKQDGKFVVNFSNVLVLVYDQQYMPASFRIELSANGDIAMYYDNYDGPSTFQSGSTLFCAINDPEMSDAVVLTSADRADYWGNEEVTADNSRYQLFQTGTAVMFQAPKASFVTALSDPHGLVSPGETVTLTATLAADATMNAGPTFNNLAIVTNDPEPAVSAVRINAVIDGAELVAVAALESDDIDFGDVFRTADVKLPVTVKNTGHRDLTVSAAAFAQGKYTLTAELPVTVQAGMSKDLIVTVPTDTEGELSDVLTVTTDGGVLTATVHGRVAGTPALQLSETAFSYDVVSGTPTTAVLSVSNTGNEPLVYSLTPDALVGLDVPQREGTVTSYTYTSSVDDSNVKYNWVDIETTGLGTQNAFNYYNLHDYVEVELPFEFPFYGKKYDKMYIYNTGFVSFTQRHDDRIWPEPPADFPEGTVFNNYIAPYWGLHSMDITKTAGTFHYVTDNQAVVSFMEYGNSMNIGVCYQLILNADGSFTFQYKGANDGAVLYGMFGLAGIVNDDYSQSIRLPERMVAFDNAIAFKPVQSNTLQAGATDQVGLTFDTDRMAGQYTTNLVMDTNVPGSEKVEIPVTLNIQGETKAVWPDDVVVEQTMGYQSTDTENLMVQMGAAYDAPFTVANEGTAALTLADIAVGGPMNYDEWFDEYTPAFMLFYQGPEIDWITGEPTGNMMWQQYMQGTPVEINDVPLQFSVPMLPGEQWATPGEYDVPVTFTYYNGSLASLQADDDPVFQQHVVNVKFIVTPMPVLGLDRYEVALTADTDDYTASETVNLANYGEYALKYSLRLDPTGVGEELPDMGGGVAPVSTEAKAAAIDTELVKAALVPAMKPLDKSTNAYDTPQAGFDYNDALFYPAMPGNTTAYNYGSNSQYDVYKASTQFKAPADGFNISHVYIPVFLDGATDYTVRLQVIQGTAPDGDVVLGTGTLFIDKQPGGQFYIVPLDKPVYMNPGEDFCLVATYDAGVPYPSYVCAKEEAVVANRYMGWMESVGWFDAADVLQANYGSLGYIMTCLETVEGEPWVKLLDASGAEVEYGKTVEGAVEVGQTAAVTIAVNAASARMDKGNRAVLVIKTNDPQQPVFNLPITLDKNGAPVIDAPQTLIHASEGQTTTVTLTVSDADAADTLTLGVDDGTGMASIEAVTAVDPSATVTAGQDGLFTVAGAGAAPVTVSVALKPDFGQAGDNYAFVLNATDDKGHAAEATVRYAVQKVNRAPVAVDAEPVVVKIGTVSDPLSFASLFDDPDGDDLTFEFSMFDNDYVDAYTTATGAVFAAKKLGQATAAVTATDAEGLTATAKVTVIVNEVGGVDDITADSADGSGLVALVDDGRLSGAVTLLGLTDGQATVSVYNTAGTLLGAENLTLAHSHNVTLTGAAAQALVAPAPGTYLLQVTVGNQSQTLRLIRN